MGHLLAGKLNGSVQQQQRRLARSSSGRLGQPPMPTPSSSGSTSSANGRTVDPGQRLAIQTGQARLLLELAAVADHLGGAAEDGRGARYSDRLRAMPGVFPQVTLSLQLSDCHDCARCARVQEGAKGVGPCNQASDHTTRYQRVQGLGQEAQ